MVILSTGCSFSSWATHDKQTTSTSNKAFIIDCDTVSDSSTQLGPIVPFTSIVEVNIDIAITLVAQLVKRCFRDLRLPVNFAEVGS